MRKKRKVKILRIFIVLILLVFIILLFLKNNDSSNKNSKVVKDSNKKDIKQEKKENGSNYNLRENEEFISKTKTNLNLTKYNGAYYVDGVMIVNKSYPLDSTYKPVNPYKPITSDYIYGEDYLEKEVMEAFIKMKTEAQKLGYSLKITSGYRSYNVQVDLYNNYLNRDGKEAADTYSARAGYSEHQSGLCMDINGTNENFLNTETGKWVNENAYKYGFILRFPENKEDITGYNYEAWHFRYVGFDLAKKLYNNGNWISLEEYMGIDSKYK